MKLLEILKGKVTMSYNTVQVESKHRQLRETLSELEPDYEEIRSQMYGIWIDYLSRKYKVEKQLSIDVDQLWAALSLLRDQKKEKKKENHSG